MLIEFMLLRSVIPTIYVPFLEIKSFLGSTGKNPVVSCDAGWSWLHRHVSWRFAPFLVKLFFTSVGKIRMYKGNRGSCQIFLWCTVLL